MNSRKKNLFTEVPVKRPSRNYFDLSHEVKMSGKFGALYPVLLLDTMPGDQISDQMTAMVRFAPMLAPVMHRCDVSTHFFFVPNRILCDPWEEFITGGQDGLADTVLPYITTLAMTEPLMAKGTLWDYLGLPPSPQSPPYGADRTPEQLSVLPFRAYAKIWNDYYRDPNLDTELDLETEAEGPVTSQSITAQLFTLRYRAFDKDYFTAALPFAQRGASVLLPLAGTGTVVYSPQTFLVDETSVSAGPLQASATGGPTIRTLTDDTGEEIQLQNIESVVMDESTITINDFRRAMAIQKWMENNARGGGRYIEQIESHFSERVPDFRLQRAEYLGGGKQPVVISEVRATAASDVSSEFVPVGDMAGHGLSVGKSNRFSYRCKEHGWVLGILSVTYKTAYSQGIDKMWTRNNRFDFPWPELAHLGEQEILSKELFFSYDNANTADNNELFGYIPRYAEYKFKNDRLAGDFRDTLAFWHLSRFFDSRPTLTAGFTTLFGDQASGEEAPDRIFAVRDGTDYLWMQLFHRLSAVRPLPYFGVPTIS